MYTVLLNLKNHINTYIYKSYREDYSKVSSFRKFNGDGLPISIFLCLCTLDSSGKIRLLIFAVHYLISFTLSTSPFFVTKWDRYSRCCFKSSFFSPFVTFSINRQELLTIILFFFGDKEILKDLMTTSNKNKDNV